MSVLSDLRRRVATGAKDVRGAASPDVEPASPADAAPTPPTSIGPDPDAPPFALDAQQKAFFDTFGFLKIPGLFRYDIAAITAGFEEIFDGSDVWETHEKLHFEQTRKIIPAFVERSERLGRLRDDPRVSAVLDSLFDQVPYEYAESDGNLFSCDTSWHPDTYGSPLERLHIKLSFYLDPLHGDNGAIRMIPGTSHWQSPFATGLRRDLYDVDTVEATFGVHPRDIPSWTLENDPGDLIVWSFRTIHASFNGGERRRLFSMNYREVVEPT